MKIVSISLEGGMVQGRVTDMDALYIAGLLLPNYFEIRNSEQGLKAAFEQFSAENAEALKTGTDNADNMYTTWGERLLIRLTNNLEIRAGFAQRITEIFSKIDRTLVDYKRWTDPEGNVYNESSIRLDIDQMMTLVTEIANVITDEKKPAAKNKAAKPKGFKAQVADLDQEPDEEPSEVEILRARLAQLEASPA